MRAACAVEKISNVEIDNGSEQGLAVRTSVKAGVSIGVNHSQPTGLRVRTQVKAGKIVSNHSEATGLKVRSL